MEPSLKFIKRDALQDEKSQTGCHGNAKLTTW